MTKWSTKIIVSLLLASVWACRDADGGAESTVVDSIVSRAVALQRFQEGLSRPNGLIGGQEAARRSCSASSRPWRCSIR